MSDTKALYGEVDFVRCEKISFETFNTEPYRRGHCIGDIATSAEVRKYRRLFAFHVANPVRYEEPLPYSVSSSVTWRSLPARSFRTHTSPSAISLNLTESIPERHEVLVAEDADLSTVAAPAPQRRRLRSLRVAPEAALGLVRERRRSAPSFAVARIAARRAWEARVSITKKFLLTLDPDEANRFLGYTDAVDMSFDSAACGLRNLGNTCYGNALLACLARVRPVQAWVSQHLSRHTDDATHDSRCALCCLARDTYLLRTLPRNEPIQPETMQLRGHWGGHTFAGVEQQDAQEAFVALLNACDGADVSHLHNLLGEAPGAVLVHSTPRWRLFGGLVRTHLRCNACGYNGFTYNVFDHVQLQLRDNDLITVEDLLAHAQDKIFLDSATDICARPSCRAPAQLTKEDRFIRWPRVLVLHLKRWDYDSVRMRPLLVGRPISYETVLPLGDGLMYHLVGVVAHSGGVGIGHYTAYVRSSSHAWFCYDDSLAPRACATAEALGARAYLLFYERC